MELELKHIIDHAKHGGKLRCLDDDNIYFDDEIKIIDFVTGYIETKEGLMIELSDFGSSIFMVKRPLSDLEKEIEINGEKFVPLNELNKKINIGARLDCDLDIEIEESDSYIYITSSDWMSLRSKLNEWHFDDGLIKKGLAIDINTLK